MTAAADQTIQNMELAIIFMMRFHKLVLANVMLSSSHTAVNRNTKDLHSEKWELVK